MTNKRPERKTTQKVVATRSPRTTKKVAATEKATASPKGTFDYFRISESYTSLILGVVVVVITSLLLLTFLRNRTNVSVPQSTKDISTAMKIGPTVSLADSISEAPNDVQSNATSHTVKPTVVEVTTEPTKMPTPTLQPTVTPTAVPTKVEAKPTIAPTTKPEVKPTTVVVRPSGARIHATVYTTKAGDDLWGIAEKYYNSGYNWVDIAKANNLSNADVIYSGMKLTIPAVEKKIATVTATPTPTAMSAMNRPNQNHVKTYTVKPGDDLWDVALAVYKDGYRWTDIAKANNLTNPNVIHSGNVLKIP